MDNFYTSPKLLTDLFAMKFGACGTYRDYSHGMQLSHSQNNLPGDPSGWTTSICEGDVCSTIYSAYTGETVQRRVKTQDTWKTKTFPCPAPVTAYNEHMEGVDQSNKLLQYNIAQHKRMKWYRKIFLHFLDIDAMPPMLPCIRSCGT